MNRNPLWVRLALCSSLLCWLLVIALVAVLLWP